MGKTVTTSTNGADAEKALDTVVSGGNVWKSDNELQPWLMVDLKKPYLISFVVWTGVPVKTDRVTLKKLFVKIGELKSRCCNIKQTLQF